MTSDGFYTLGVCATSLEHPRYEDLVRRLERESIQYGVHLLVFACYNDMTYRDSYDQGEKSIFQILPYNLLDGLVILTESFKDIDLAAQISRTAIEHNCPVISLDAELEGCCNISFAYGEAFGQLVEHIIVEHGCRRINLMAGFKGNAFEIERTEVFRRTMAKHGIPVEEERIDYGDFWDHPTYLAIDRMVASGLPMPEAIICQNDAMAIASCRQLKKHGYRVPEDILVTGLDGIDFAKKHTPRLTTAMKDQDGCVRKIFEVFFKGIKGESIAGSCRIPFIMSVDQSCGCVSKELNDANELLITEMQRWEDAKSYDSHMKNMQNDTIRLRYRDMLHPLERYVPEDCFICLRTDYNSILDTPPDYGTYEDDSPAFTSQMNAIISKFGGICRYNHFFALTELVPESDQYIIDNNGLLFVPLHFQEIVFGYLAISLTSRDGGFDRVRRFAGAMSTILQVIQQQEHVRILNRQMEAANQKLTDLYNLDPLTGILNRRGFHDHFNKYIAEQDISKQQFILMSIDMDGLKTVNDTYGHKEGDFSLCMISDCLKHLCRQYEQMTCARFGGDEFIVAGFCEDDDTLLPKLEKFLASQMEFLNAVSGKEYTVAASIGSIVIPPGKEFDVETFINQADALMYKNKQARKSE